MGCAESAVHRREGGLPKHREGGDSETLYRGTLYLSRILMDDGKKFKGFFFFFLKPTIFRTFFKLGVSLEDE